jgi:hypothetical protein
LLSPAEAGKPQNPSFGDVKPQNCNSSTASGAHSTEDAHDVETACRQLLLHPAKHHQASTIAWTLTTNKSQVVEVQLGSLPLLLAAEGLDMGWCRSC